MNRPTVSVVLATYNEEANIKRCLESVCEICDEIIVVDGNSKDNTVSIAKTFGAVIIQTDNKPIFHINKQMAMDAANGKIVLQLDADEVVDSTLLAFIKKLKQNYEHKTIEKVSGPVAWWIRRRNFFLGKFLTKGGQYPDPVIRLYINGFAKLPQKDVHEQMVVDGEVATAPGHLLHYSNPSFDVYIRKWNAYTSLAAQQLEKESKKLNFKLCLEFFLIKPIVTFFSLFIRHKGLLDGFPGFVFALMSSIFHQVTLLKFWELKNR